jgi:pimeloyl-ACP methyl ester carboxylesterase
MIIGLGAGRAAASDLLDGRARAAIAEFNQLEAQKSLKHGHASLVRLHRDREGRPLRTARTTLIISGLFNSPKSMRALEDYFFARGENVVNLRLAGHYERDLSVLRESVEFATWRAQSRAAFEVASLMSDRVTLVGHSTGALLNTWLAVENPERVAGLALFAPAFGLSPALRQLLAVEKNLYVKSLRGRVRTLHAGREVQKLAQSFCETLMSSTGRPGFAGAQPALARIPVWVCNTNFDAVIDLPTVDRFTAEIAEASAARGTLKLSRWHFVKHDDLAAPGVPLDWRWGRLTKAMGRTLYGE